MRVADVASWDVLVLHPRMSIDEGLACMASRPGVAAVVLDDALDVVGVLSPRDVVGALAKGRASGTVSEHMFADPPALRPDDDARMASRSLIWAGSDILPVVADGQCLGVVSAAVLAAALRRQREAVEASAPVGGTGQGTLRAEG